MELPPALDPYHEAAERALRDIVAQQEGPLYRLLGYQLGWLDEHGEPASHPADGPRLRPLLCLGACAALGADWRQALVPAAAVELVYQFSLVHDDVEDGSPVRRNRPTAWWLWGPAQAINAGDGLHALARLALLRYGAEQWGPERLLALLRPLDRAVIRLCEGQHQDLLFQERLDITTQQYLKVARDMTGALLGCAMELGARVATEDEAVCRAFAEAGELLGVAYQVRDDILELWPERRGGPPEAVAGDILSKSKRFPLAYALEKASLRQKRELGALYMKRVLEPPDVAQVLAALDSLEARAASQQVVEEHAQGALERLRGLPLTPEGRSHLEALVRSIVERER